MEEPQAKGLEELTDEEIEALAGGYIVDMGVQPDDTYDRYAVVDYKTGNIIAKTTTLADAKAYVNGSKAPGEGVNPRWKGLDAVISPFGYEELFGKPLA